MMNSVIIGLLVAISIVVEYMLLENDEERMVFSEKLMTGVVMGALVGCINYFTVKVVILTPFFLIAMIALMSLLIAWWKAEGATLAELVPMVALAIICFLVAKSTAWAAASLVESPFWSSVVVFIPTAMLIGTIGFFISDSFLDYSLFKSESGEDDGAFAALGWGTAVLAAILIFFLAVSQIAWGDIGSRVGYTNASREEASLSSEDFVYTDDTDEYAPAKTDSDEWYGFYNLSLQDDDDSSNDYNFGYEPEEEFDAEAMDFELRERMKLDPALAAADTAWLDANVGTRYLGEFYESCKGDWAKTINLAKIRFMADQSAYYKNLDAFFAFLDSADEVKVEYRDSGLDDQMYMNPFTVDGVPDVIVMETPDHDGWFLVYTFVIKGTPVDVAYRIDCGFQPTNVEEVMHITPKPQPEKVKEPETTKAKKKTTPEPETKAKKKTTPEPETKKPKKPEPETTKPEPTKPKPTKPEPTKPEPTKPEPTKPEPTKPKPTEPETTHPVKDKSKGTKGDVVKPNDDPGPGEDTNNGKDAKTSKKDQDTNSNHFDSYDEYTKAVKELEKVNKEQKKGGDDNTPSTPKPKKDTKVDSNADKDQGNGNIDTPTPTKEPAKKADDNKPITTEPAGQWDGPAD